MGGCINNLPYELLYELSYKGGQRNGENRRVVYSYVRFSCLSSKIGDRRACIYADGMTL